MKVELSNAVRAVDVINADWMRHCVEVDALWRRRLRTESRNWFLTGALLGAGVASLVWVILTIL